MRRTMIRVLPLMIVLLILSCSKKKEDESGGSGEVVYQVKYEVTGTAKTVFVTYVNESGGTSQESNVSLPWSYTFTAKPGDFVYISAQNEGETGSVTVTIYKNGSIFKTSTSSGAYVIAEASGSL